MNPNDSLLVDLALRRGLISSDQAEACRSADRTAAEWLVDHEVLSSQQAGELQHAVLDLMRNSSLPSAKPEPPKEEGFPRDFGAYRLLAELGRGGMGVVYRAEQKALGRHVALKVLEIPPEHARADSLARFQRESQVMARLTHPDIVAIHDFGTHEGRWFFAMDLVAGMSLDRYLRTYFPTREQSLRIVSRIARALSYAHVQGVVHRDVKPANILVDLQGNPKLTDFGLAKADGASLTCSGVLLGTPLYMSPEQALGEKSMVDARSDIYSLGTVMYEMLTGRTPFSGTTVESIVRQVARDVPPPPGALRAGLPINAETICLKAMAKDPRNRYATAADLADDLDRFLKGEPILARRPSAAERAWRWAGRHKGLVASLAVALLFGAAGTAGILHLSKRLKEQQNREDLDRRAARAETLYQQMAYGEALPILRSLRGTPADRPAIVLMRAKSLAATGHRPEAERELRAYLEHFPEDAAAWRFRGLNALEGGDLSAAVSNYRKAGTLAHIPYVLDAEARGDFDAVIALVERHFFAVDPQHARPFLASYDPQYKFQKEQQAYTPAYGLSSEWWTRFPPKTMSRLSEEEMRKLIAKEGEHPVPLLWQGEEDRAVAALPIGRWFRYYRLLSYRSSGRMEEAKREREAIRTLCLWDPEIGTQIVRRLCLDRDYAWAAREYEELYDGCDQKRSPQTWDGYLPPNRLILYAARCSALAGDLAETLRILTKGRKYLDRSQVGGEPDFASLKNRKEFQDFLATLPER